MPGRRTRGPPGSLATEANVNFHGSSDEGNRRPSKQVKPNSPNGPSVETGQAQRRSTASPKSPFPSVYAYASSDRSVSRRLRRRSLRSSTRPNPPSVLSKLVYTFAPQPFAVAVTEAHSGHARYSNGTGGLFDVWSQNYILLIPRCGPNLHAGLLRRSLRSSSTRPCTRARTNPPRVASDESPFARIHRP